MSDKRIVFLICAVSLILSILACGERKKRDWIPFPTSPTVATLDYDSRND